MRLIVLLLLTFVAFPAHPADEPLAFKSLTLGTSEEEVLNKYPKLNCRGEPAKRGCFRLINEKDLHKLVVSCVARGGSLPECRQQANESLGVETVAGAPVSFMAFRFNDNILGLISLTTPSSEFDRIADAFIGRYGKPTQDKIEPFTTKAGQTYENRELQWLTPAGIIRLKRLSGRLDRSTVMYLSPEAGRAFAEDARQVREKTASDL